MVSTPAPPLLPAAAISLTARVSTAPDGMTTRPRESTTSLATLTRTRSPTRVTRECTESIIVVPNAVPLAIWRWLDAGAGGGVGVAAGGGVGRGRGAEAGGGAGRSVYT